MTGATSNSSVRMTQTIAATNVSAAVKPAVKSGRYDHAERKQAKRAGRERGCWVYIAAEELTAAGFDPHDAPPFYLAHGYQRSKNAGSVMVSLYRVKS